ncbi:MAG: VWA domain-containing protein [Desulfatitalea sp.]
MYLKFPFIFLLLVVTAICAYGQDQPMSRRVTGKEVAAGARVIINEVNTDQYPNVRIFATVLKEGAPLKGLGASDFRVREDEVDQEPLTVEPKLPPLSVVITLDTSGSMSKRMKEAQAAAMSFVDTLGSHDSAQVVAFAREVKRLTTMSTNRQATREAIEKTVARGDTALYDALYESIQLVKDRTGRKAIVLLSDGVDDDGTGRALSKHTVKDVLGLAREVNVPIYVLGLGTEIDEAGLTETATETGALYYKAPQASELKALYAQIGAQLAGQYAIYYTSNLPADGTQHRIALTAQSISDTKVYKAPGQAAVKEEVTQKAEVKPEPEKPTQKVIKLGTGIGTISIPNLNPKGNLIPVYEQSSGKKIGDIHAHIKFLQVPAGTYKLKFGEIMLEGIEVGAGATKEVLLGTLAIPNLKDGLISVSEQSSGKKIGDIYDHIKFLQVPAGTYKLKVHGAEIKDIVVEAGQEVILE